VGLLNSHLDDAAFADVWTERAASGSAESGRPAESHLRACADCRARYAAFSGWLDTLRADATAEAEEALGAERLAAQQAQISRRLEALEQPGRVLAFPRFAQPTSMRPSDGRRWIAGAAAAGLVVGLGLGQMLEFGGDTFRSNSSVAGAPQQVAFGGAVGAETARAGLQPVGSSSDETYLYELDVLPSQARVPESLQYLNAITPSARDYDPR
jgi:hypothetical protein